MEPIPAVPPEPDKVRSLFYVDVLRSLDRAGVPHAVGGTYAFSHYTGISRGTKDLDVCVRPQDRDRALTTLAAAGYHTEFFYPFWISKAICGEAFCDVIYDSGNGLCPVDDDWFRHANDVDVLDYPTRVVPAEELLWTKAFVMDRDRFDGADVLHLILGRGARFDWDRLVWRFRGHERVLLAHLLLFGYAYPSEKRVVPYRVIEHLERSVRDEPLDGPKVCRGTFLAQRGYSVPLREWGFADGRAKPHGPLGPEELAQLPQE